MSIPRPLLPLALFFAGCGGGDGSHSPDVIVLVLDTLRADHLGCYGDGRNLTPRLDGFAAGSTRYANTHATAPWTVPTHASLFTGLFPFEHGAHTGPIQRTGENVRPLPGEHTTLAEILAAEGYATGGFVANAVYLDPRYGLSQGFETWDVARERAGDLNERALAWVDATRAEDPDRPLLLFVNYLDTHRPYNVEALPGEKEYDEVDFPANVLERLIQTVMVEGGEDPELEALAREQYARSVRNLDLALGKLFEDLEERGGFEDAVVVITSDHGEYFGEHGLVEHSKDVYEEALRVPLIVRAPGQREGRVVEEAASAVDVPALVVEHLPGSLAERFPRRPGGHLVLAQNHFSRPRDVLQPAYGTRFQRVRTAVYSGAWKFIHSSDGAHELYRLEDDPTESNDRAAEEMELVTEFVAKVEALIESGRWKGPLVEVGPMSAELEAQMRALGYAGED